MLGSPAFASRAHAVVLLTALLLAFIGFLAYLAVPKQCTDVTRYIHATIIKDQPGAEGAAAGQANGTTGCSNSSAAVAAGSSVPLSLLSQLLPLTNFSSIKSADLLDAAAASMGHRGLRQLMQLHNKLFCASKLHLEPLPGSVAVPFAHAVVILTALLLAFIGFLAYLAVPKQCTDVTRYIHATIIKDQPGAEGAAAGQANGTTGCSSSTAAVAAGSSVELSLLSQLLPLTNFSSIKSADLLDAAAASVGHRGLRQLMQLHNKLFCASKLHLEPLPGSVAVPFGNVSMYVYDNNDIVSNSIKGQGHGWEAAETQEMLWAIRQFPQTRQLLLRLMGRRYDSPSPAKSIDPATKVLPDAPLVVDVGANVGWFMLNAAAARARVAAFEAMPANIALLRRSLCANPWLEERIALYGTGLSDESNTCHIISGTGNIGDGITLCDKDPAQAEKRAHNTPGYESRGTMTVRRLDTLLSEDVQLMKIDVEGWETHVLQGGEGLLQQYNVWYIMAECNTGMIGEEGGKQFIRFMDAHGYAASTTSFQGPFWSTEDIQLGKAACTNINLYCVKKEAVGNQQAAAAAGSHNAGIGSSSGN